MGTSLHDLTHDDLDALAEAEGVEGYPKSGNKDEKVEALTQAGVAAPDDDDVKLDPGTEYDSRYDANLDYFKLTDQEREALMVHEDAETGTYRIGPKDK